MKTIKKIAIILMVALMACAFSGCAQMVSEITINEDGSAKVDFTVGMLNSMLEQTGYTAEETFAEQKEAYEEEGYTVTSYGDEEDADYAGIIATKEFTTVDSLEDEEALEGFTVTVADGTYTVSIDASEVTGDMEESGADLETLSQMGKLDARVVVNFPYEVTEHNGTSISDDKKTVTWDLLTFEGETMTATAVKPVNIVLIVGIIAAVVVAAAVVVIVVLKSKKKAAPAEEPAAEAAPAEEPAAETAPAEEPAAEAFAAEEPATEAEAPEAPAEENTEE